jgi:hypothetical protein
VTFVVNPYLNQRSIIMAGSEQFSFRDWMRHRESVLSVGRIGPWRLLPGIARIKVSSKWKELFGGRRISLPRRSGGDGGGRLRVEGREFGVEGRELRVEGRELRVEGREFGARGLWGPETFPEYLAMIEPGDRERVAAGASRAFLTCGGAGGALPRWEATFRRGGLVILARAEAVSPGHVVGVDIDVTGIGDGG